MALPETTDFLIAGGGVLGLTLALELKSRFPDCTVVLLEKEDKTGLHASGRNSGVLHAGFYYSPTSPRHTMSSSIGRGPTSVPDSHVELGITPNYTFYILS